VGAATTSRVARCARARACAATASGGGARRRDEVGPEQARGGAHSDAEVAASLTIGLDGGEWWRTSGAAALDGRGRRGLPAGLRNERGGRVRGEIGREEVGEAPPTRNWRSTH